MGRSTAISILFTLTCLCPAGSRAEWDAFGLADRMIFGLELSDDRLYACTDDGVYRRDLSPAASPWVSIGLQTRTVRALLVLSSDTLLAATETSPSDRISLYRTTDAGSSWHAYQNGFGAGGNNPEVAALTRLPHQPATLIAVGSSIEKSLDAGAKWQARASGCVFNFVEANPYATSQVWAGGESCIFSPVLFKSADSGDTWELFQLDAGGDNACDAVAFHPSAPDVVYVGMEGRIMRTMDGGTQWETLPTPDPAMYHNGLAISKQLPSRLYLAGSSSPPHPSGIVLHKSDDGGFSWTSVAQAAPIQFGVFVLVLVSTEGVDTIWLGTDRGIYRYRQVVTAVTSQTWSGVKSRFRSPGSGARRP